MTLFLWIAIVLVVPLIVVGGVMDLRARRRGVRYQVDGNAGRDARRSAEAEGTMRTHGQIGGPGPF